MRKALAFSLLLAACGGERESYPREPGNPCGLGDPPSCSEEGFVLTCDPVDTTRWSEDARRYFTAMGLLGSWQLNLDQPCP